MVNPTRRLLLEQSGVRPHAPGSTREYRRGRRACVSTYVPSHGFWLRLLYGNSLVRSPGLADRPPTGSHLPAEGDCPTVHVSETDVGSSAPEKHQGLQVLTDGRGHRGHATRGSCSQGPQPSRGTSDQRGSRPQFRHSRLARILVFLLEVMEKMKRCRSPYTVHVKPQTDVCFCLPRSQGNQLYSHANSCR